MKQTQIISDNKTPTDPNGSRETGTAYFERFALEMPSEAVADCSHQGQCDDDVAHWARLITRPADITPETLRAELKEYGAWDATELDDDQQNWHRIIWIAAGNLNEDMRNSFDENLIA